MFQGINWMYVTIGALPVFFNVGILAYILFWMPKRRETNVFSMFILALIFWQSQDFLLRVGISESSARFVFELFSIGWMMISSLLFHFVCILTEKKLFNHRVSYLIVYGPSIVFYVFHQADPTTFEVSYQGFWGYVVNVRPNTTDLVQRIWIFFQSFLGLSILVVSSFNKEGSANKRKQYKVLALGGLAPLIIGGVTQVMLPSLGLKEIPMTSFLLSIFTFSSILALGKYKLFDVTRSLDSKKILKSLNHGVMVLSIEDEVIYANPASHQMFPFGRLDNFPNMREVFYSESDYQKFYIEVVEKARLGERVNNFKFSFKAMRGQIKYVMVTAHIIQEGSKNHGLIIHLNDITELIHANETIDIINKRFKYVSKASNEAIWEWDIEGGVVYWGDSYSHLFGHKLSGGVSSIDHWEKRLHPDDREKIVSFIKDFVERQSDVRWEQEYRFQKRCGEYAYVLDKGYLIKDVNGKPYRMVGAMQDITHIRSYIDKIERQNTELCEITWMQSHEVRAPLARLMAVCNLLQEHGLQLMKEDEAVELISSSCVELDEVIRRIVKKAEKVKG
ncbi:PAS domain-containing protein [Echinicola sp. CAU 1574]|uniref:histidine kinase n=1 Tax=Echinicola arenosa TaxID=2774144 RepID=A0ABR9AI63_9BACT|nr:PAS domain-containing protein [Echinicola arenosa]MBD8488486.1 PAS domain-containing protein [Echinicola arenosa]